LEKFTMSTIATESVTGYDLWNMAPDPRDPLRPVSQVARQILGPNAPPPRVLSRWAGKGLTLNGRRYRLPVVRVGSQVLTTAAGFRWFIHAMNSEPRRVELKA
jgi:hypothetical protein